VWVEGGVYCFDEFSPSTAQGNAIDTHNLWHGRLGHPSDQVLSLLFKDFIIGRNENKDLVLFVSVLNKLELSLSLVTVIQKNCLDLFIVIFGVHIIRSPCGAQYFFYNC